MQDASCYKNTETYLLHCSPKFPLSALMRILPGTFVGLGILGTFLGFSNGISEIRLTENVDELFRNLDTFFGGLNTAFFTSIAGVVLSVLFGILYQFPLNKIKYHCERIQSELNMSLAPAESAKDEFNQYIQSIHEMTQTLLAAKESIETLPQKFLDVGNSLEASVTPVKDTFTAMQATLENYSRQAESLQNASAQIQHSLTTFIETSDETTKKIGGSLEQTIAATKEIQENNAHLNSDHSKMLEDYKALLNTLSSVQEKIRGEVAAYSDKIKNQLTQMLTACSEQSLRILQTQNAQMLEDYRKLDENIASILETVNKNLADYSATIKYTLVQTLEEYNKAARNVSAAFFGETK